MPPCILYVWYRLMVTSRVAWVGAARGRRLCSSRGKILTSKKGLLAANMSFIYRSCVHIIVNGSWRMCEYFFLFRLQFSSPPKIFTPQYVDPRNVPPRADCALFHATDGHYEVNLQSPGSVPVKISLICMVAEVRW